MLSSEEGRDMLQDDTENDREGSKSDGSSMCEDEEESGGRSEMEEGGGDDDDSCNDDGDAVVRSGNESVNGSQSGVR